jgi:hypothetical protein
MDDAVVVEVEDGREHVLKHTRGVDLCETFLVAGLAGQLIKQFSALSERERER